MTKYRLPEKKYLFPWQKIWKMWKIQKRVEKNSSIVSVYR